jgi:hypothetical protein
MSTNRAKPVATERPSILPGLLASLGMIGTPTGVVAIFCKIMNVSDQTTSAISLATMCIVAICLFRQSINQRVPAALLLGLLIGLAAVFFLNYQNILLKNTGLVRYYKKSSDLQADIGEEMENAKQEILMFGMDFRVSSVDRRTVLLKKLDQGLKIRYLIFDPYSSRIDDLARDFDQPKSELKDECVRALQSLVELRHRWSELAPHSSHPGELDVRLFDITPHARLYIFDPGVSKGRTFYVPYINRVNSPEVPGFLLENIGTGVYGDYVGGVQRLWQESVDISGSLQLHPELKNF